MRYDRKHKVSRDPLKNHIISLCNTAIQEIFKTLIIIELLSIIELHYVGAAKWQYCTLIVIKYLHYLPELAVLQ